MRVNTKTDPNATVGRRSRWMVEDNWIGFLVFVVATILVLLTAGCIGWFQRSRERRELRRLQEKYVEKPHG